MSSWLAGLPDHCLKPGLPRGHRLPRDTARQEAAPSVGLKTRFPPGHRPLFDGTKEREERKPFFP